MKKILELFGKYRRPGKCPTAVKPHAQDERARRELSARDALWESLMANRINVGR